METSESSNNELRAAADDISPNRTVRTNWLRYAWSQISEATKALLILSITISLIQISTTVVILILGGRDNISCDKPLQLYLIVFVVRVGVALPLSIYQHLFATRRRGRRRGRRDVGNRINDNNNNTAVRPSPQQESTTTTEEVEATTSLSAANNDNENGNNTEVISQQQQQQQQQQEEISSQHQQPSTIVSGWSERLKSLLDLFAILWFIVGNYLVFSSSYCSVAAPLYYYTILTWILFGYTILVFPLLACASVIFCLPCVLVTMRLFNINVSTVMKGGTKEELAKIPVYRYKVLSDDDSEQQPQQQPSSSTITEQQQTNNTPTMKKANYFRRFMKRRKSEMNTTTSTTEEQHPYLTIPKAEDAICSICLSEYENDELICKLWCNHHYHESCVIEWLALNTKCPLCKRDFRGKNYIGDDDSGDEEEHA